MFRGGVKTALFMASAIVYLYQTGRNASGGLIDGKGAFLQITTDCGKNPRDSIRETEKSMSKVLFLVNHEIVIYNFRLEIVERMLAEGHTVVISSPPGERIDELVRMGCCFRPVELCRRGVNPLDELKLCRYYRKLLAEEKPDLVLTYTIKPNIYGGLACAGAGVPYVATITGLGSAMERKGWLRWVAICGYRLALRRVQRVFFQNSENQEFFVRRKLALDRQMLLPGSGVNLQRFCALPYPADDTVEFGFYSRIMEEKGIEQYFAAAEIIRERYPHTRFHVCGFCEEAYEERLRDLHDRGVIIYHGMVRDIRTVIAGTHCTIHPTCYPEGLSNVLLESAACARPLIATDRSGCREAIDEGVNGYLVQQRDVADLTDKIERFLALSWAQRRDMGLASRRKAEVEFDRQIVVDRVMQELAAACAD